MKPQIVKTACLIAALALAGAAHAQAPAWWAARGIVDTNLPGAQNDYAPLNQGQLKALAVGTYNELDALLIAGTNLDALIGSLTNAGNYRLATVGQLKYVAQPFYDRLYAAGLSNAMPSGMTGVYPWDNQPETNDYAAAVVGQAKYMFSFDLWVDTDQDELPDAWELRYFQGLAQGAGDDPDGDGQTNLQEYQAATDPAHAPFIAVTLGAFYDVRLGGTTTVSLTLSGTNLATNSLWAGLSVAPGTTGLATFAAGALSNQITTGTTQLLVVGVTLSSEPNNLSLTVHENGLSVTSRTFTVYTLTYESPAIVPVGGTQEVEVTLQPAALATNIVFELTRVAGGAGQATFADGRLTNELAGSGTLSVVGVAESDAPENIRLSGSPGGREAQATHFTAGSFSFDVPGYVRRGGTRWASIIPSLGLQGWPMEVSVERTNGASGRASFTTNTWTWTTNGWAMATNGATALVVTGEIVWVEIAGDEASDAVSNLCLRVGYNGRTCGTRAFTVTEVAFEEPRYVLADRPRDWTMQLTPAAAASDVLVRLEGGKAFVGGGSETWVPLTDGQGSVTVHGGTVSETVDDQSLNVLIGDEVVGGMNFTVLAIGPATSQWFDVVVEGREKAVDLSVLPAPPGTNVWARVERVAGTMGEAGLAAGGATNATVRLTEGETALAVCGLAYSDLATNMRWGVTIDGEEAWATNFSVAEVMVTGMEPVREADFVGITVDYMPWDLPGGVWLEAERTNGTAGRVELNGSTAAVQVVGAQGVWVRGAESSDLSDNLRLRVRVGGEEAWATNSYVYNFGATTGLEGVAQGLMVGGRTQTFMFVLQPWPAGKTVTLRLGTNGTGRAVFGNGTNSLELTNNGPVTIRAVTGSDAMNDIALTAHWNPNETVTNLTVYDVRADRTPPSLGLAQTGQVWLTRLLPAWSNGAPQLNWEFWGGELVTGVETAAAEVAIAGTNLPWLVKMRREGPVMAVVMNGTNELTSVTFAVTNMRWWVGKSGCEVTSGTVSFVVEGDDGVSATVIPYPYPEDLAWGAEGSPQANAPVEGYMVGYQWVAAGTYAVTARLESGAQVGTSVTVTPPRLERLRVERTMEEVGSSTSAVAPTVYLAAGTGQVADLWALDRCGEPWTNDVVWSSALSLEEDPTNAAHAWLALDEALEGEVTVTSGGIVKSVYLVVLNVEKIFICNGDAANAYPGNDIALTNYLVSIGATNTDGVWIYDDLNTLTRFETRIIADQASFSDALQVTNAYVAFHGHSNYGMGFAWTNNLTNITDFFNVGTPKAGVVWSGILEQQPALNIQSSDIAASPTNYFTFILYIERFVNFSGSFQGTNIAHIGTISPSNVFDTVYGAGTNRFHYYALSNNVNPSIILNVRYAGCDDLPVLHYKWLLIDGCFSGLYYGDSFNNGVLFFTETLSPLDSDSMKRFVKAVIEGKTKEQLKSDLNAMSSELGVGYPVVYNVIEN